ncbi:DUF1713 domain-containing protein [Mycena indigotica]|uniref:DUF1713 domain-containing protein n=1 Tax=Mycena indigotica TaxID=2126181 RepID=A0A8H6VUU8_9AGAR|nr:DUF1713 domain-containing protein [Mycena indigotica]KAF7294764.1 DUF1713 domain-containing protein [Mycena indigotica]
MSALAVGRLRQLRSFPVTRRPYSSFFSRAGGGGRYFTAHKPAKPVVGKDTPSETTEPSSQPATPAEAIPRPNIKRLEARVPPPHPVVELGDLHLHQFFSLHRPLLLLNKPASIFNTPDPSTPLFARGEQMLQSSSAINMLRQPEADVEIGRQLMRAITMNNASAAVSWESALQRLGLDSKGIQAAEWSNKWEISADSTKRKRRKKMKKHKLRKRRKLTRSERLKLK